MSAGYLNPDWQPSTVERDLAYSSDNPEPAWGASLQVLLDDGLRDEVCTGDEVTVVPVPGGWAWECRCGLREVHATEDDALEQGGQHGWVSIIAGCDRWAAA